MEELLKKIDEELRKLEENIRLIPIPSIPPVFEMGQGSHPPSPDPDTDNMPPVSPRLQGLQRKGMDGEMFLKRSR